MSVVSPELVEQLIGFVAPDFIPSSTPGVQFSTTTQLPVLVRYTNTSTQKISPSTTSIKTLIPTIPDTPEPSSTITPIPLPTPLGGAEQIAFASTRSGAAEIWVMNMDGTDYDMLTTIPEGACQPKWSPDGTKIVFISPCKRNMTSYPSANLFLMNADGSDLTPLASVPGGDYDPSWSPSGDQIAFTSLRNGGIPGIYVLTLKENSVETLVTDETRAVSQPAWSPDGKVIAYVNYDNRIWAMDTHGENRHALTIGGGDFISNGPAWSPDGSSIIYARSFMTDTTHSSVLMAVPYTETGEIPVEIPNSQLVSDASYSLDGFWLLFTSWFSGSHDINIMRVNGNDRQAIEDDPAYDFDPAWRPNFISQP